MRSICRIASLFTIELRRRGTFRVLRVCAVALLFVVILIGGKAAAHAQSGSPTPTPTPVASPTPFEGIGGYLFEGFDYAVAPGLPPGWQSSFTPGAANCTSTDTCALGTNWVTTTSNPYSGSGCVFHDAPACVTDSVLNTPSFYVSPDNYTYLAWAVHHNFNLEEGRDGGVVEISFNGGPFTDIIAAGGTANYNGTISTQFQSPIAGRQAWTGDSGGYIIGGGNLPPAAIGQSVVLRFRLGTDCSGSGTGWSMDEISVYYRTVYPPTISGTLRYCSNSVPGPVPNVTLTMTGNASYSTLSDGSGHYQFPSFFPSGSCLVTPSKNPLAPGSAGITTVDVIAVQRHFLGISLLTGCRLTAGDCATPAGINTVDVIAVQRFFLGFTNGIGNAGKYSFNPPNRSYGPFLSNQDYDTLIFGDVAAPFVTP